ncbi:hypothetical protein [Thermospira aquatica]|uniref:Tetratricopeptide repeat protein n=1 Tax=Thermospira aquatica TaxID=2828656 RepID=A0AAX3BEC3_9SPIR|nr:hypothetical protein [Thermospira aquatica]URA10687.1 hypothetical protein KDW03_02475 [Thermospira aquatica]
MKRFCVILVLIVVFGGCGKAVRQTPSVTQEEQKAQEEQLKDFVQKLKDSRIGDAERQYLQFRLMLAGSREETNFHPVLLRAFSNEFVNSLWESSAYRLAYLSYVTLTNVFTNEVADRGFLLGRAGIAAFKAKQYSGAVELLRQAFEIQVTDETLYYYGLWYWYIQKDKTKAKDILSRVRPEKLGISSRQWSDFLMEKDKAFPEKREALTLLRSTNRYEQLVGFEMWLEDYRENGKPFWQYEVTLPLYVPTNRLLGYYLQSQNWIFPRMTRDWPMPFSLRPRKPGQNRYALFMEEPLGEERFLLLYAQPVVFPWSSGYKGITPLFSREAYTNVFFVYAEAQRDTSGRLTNVGIEVVPVPVRYFLSCSPIYKDKMWNYAIVGFLPPDRLEVVVFNPHTRKMARVTASLLTVQRLYYGDFPWLEKISWLGVGEGIFLLEEELLGR